MNDFKDKVVLITGAGRGTGKALALAFAEHGAIVAANDITPINVDQVVEEIIQAGGRAKSYVVDVAKKMPVQRLVTNVTDDWGRLDILINSASVEPRTPVLDMDEWDWHRTVDVNLTGAFLTAQVAGRVMRELSGGVVVNIAARTWKITGQEHRSAYIASRAGLIAFSLEVADEFAEHNIRVNAVCPGSGASRGADIASKPLMDTPKDYPGMPHDLIDLVLYLCSEAGREITGRAIFVESNKEK